MIMSKFIKGLNILSKYFDKDGFHLGSVNDEFYVYPTSKPISHEDLKTLYALDWQQRDLDPGIEDYDSTETWVAFL